MTSAPTLVRADNLGLAYGAKWVLHDVTLEIRPGECWFFLGANGSGKTTLARAILGLIAARAGRLTKHPDLTPARVGFVPHQCGFNRTLPTTVREFASLGFAGLSLPASEQRRRLDWALDCVGLTNLLRHDFWSLSDGQRQRVLVARALVRQPALLVADEPVNGLDLATQHALLHTLGDLQRSRQTAIVFIAHDLALAACYGSHVALFRDGRVWSGPAAELLTPDQLHRTLGLPHHLCPLDARNHVACRLTGAAHEGAIEVRSS